MTNQERKKKAQAQPERKEDQGREIMEEDDQASNGRFRFNAEAPEFVPRSGTPIATSSPVPGYFYPCFHFVGGSSSSADNCIYINEEQPELQASSKNYWVKTSHNKNRNNNNNNNNVTMLPNCSSNLVIPDELKHKIIKQVISICYKMPLIMIFNILEFVYHQNSNQT